MYFTFRKIKHTAAPAIPAAKNKNADPAPAPLPNKSAKNLFLGSAIQGSKVLLFYAYVNDHRSFFF